MDKRKEYFQELPNREKETIMNEEEKKEGSFITLEEKQTALQKDKQIRMQ